MVYRMDLKNDERKKIVLKLTNVMPLVEIPKCLTDDDLDGADFVFKNEEEKDESRND